MSLSLNKKNTKILEIKENLSANKCFYICNYQKITSNKINLIRRKAKENGFKCVVYKNNLFNIGYKKFYNLQDDIENLSGQNIFLFRKDEGFKGLKEINNFTKQYDNNLKCVFAFFENSLLKEKELKKLSRYGSKNDLIASLAFVLSSPIIKLALTLKSLVSLKEENKETNKN
ncbi:50S ribosomal protein L10 [symbiont of Argiope bruennichi]|uniref:50S ribosomal protein L10 n=1 Tax=symbiont of Argiope bruennichi TaxID=2810479 RepID=UPI003DA618E4